MDENQSGSDQQAEAVQSAGPRLFDDDLYRALSARRRRRLLYVLLDHDEHTVDDLATVLTGWDATDKGGMATPEDRDAVLTSLHHVHLPLLADVGLIEYDAERNTVTIEALAPAVADLISTSIETEPAAPS